jgi:hypothetical protein
MILPLSAWYADWLRLSELSLGAVGEVGAGGSSLEPLPQALRKIHKKYLYTGQKSKIDDYLSLARYTASDCQ